MGLFSRKKKEKNKDENAKVEPVSAIEKKVFNVDPLKQSDMVSIIKKEQDNEMLNPFKKEDEVELNPNLSVAKRYGRKYINKTNSGRIASSKVVDVRSYVKPAGESRHKSEFEKSLDELENNRPVLPKFEEPKKPKNSFFDDLMKSIDEDIERLEKEEDEKLFIPESIKKPEPKTVDKKPAVKKAPTKRKKSVDIDIISGDFGGTDIL